MEHLDIIWSKFFIKSSMNEYCETTKNYEYIFQMVGIWPNDALKLELILGLDEWNIPLLTQKVKRINTLSMDTK